MSGGGTEAEQATPNMTDTTHESQAPADRNQNQGWPHRVIRRSDFEFEPLPEVAPPVPEF